MNKNVLNVIGILALAAAIGMKVMSRNARTTELSSYWWIPIPLALICFIAAAAGKKEK
jgi:hypothetical protein